jgi:hypothetical protein
MIINLSACYKFGYYYMADGVSDSNDILTFTSKEECWKGCTADARCLAWDFDINIKECRYLYQAIVGFQAWADGPYFSGLKNCV